MTDQFVLDDALALLAQNGWSDLHLTVGSVPIVRVDGELEPLRGDYEKFTPDSLHDVLWPMLTQDQHERFARDFELDLAYSAPGFGRFRVNLFWQRGSLGAAFRYIDSRIRSLEELGLPAQVRDFSFLPRGLVLVTGPTGSGKSTTLAALIDVINKGRSCHVMTIEDPIEFLHQHDQSVVNQREVGTDTHSFHDALKHVLRQDPDVILIGELRDLESISVALTAAETGHLVFATLHTVDAAKSIDRIVDVFPAAQQAQIRAQLASTLQGVVSQTLLKRKGGGRTVATEVLRVTPAVAHLLREGKTHQIYSQLQAGAEYAMHTMDQSLAELVNRGLVTYGEAREKASNVADLDSFVSRAARESLEGADAMATAGIAFDDDFSSGMLGGRQNF